MATASFPIYGKIQGPILIVGYGSIGQGVLPIIKRHFTYEKIVIIDPLQQGPNDPDVQFEKIGLTEDNYKEVIDRIFESKKGFCVNVSVQTSSKDILIYCQSKQILYVDTVVQEWTGYYSNQQIPIGDRTNYALRQRLRQACKQNPYKSTAVSCCGANPGMVSWLVKQALINIAKDCQFNMQKQPQTQQEWANLMKNLGIKGIHIAQRDTQRTNQIKPQGQFWNTWSVDGFISEGLHQASQLGWGTHEEQMPKNAQTFNYGPKCAIYLDKPGMHTKVKSWCPTFGPQETFLITHNESISITDYFTVWQDNKPVYRPTCFYAYHPSDATINSVQECLRSNKVQEKWKIYKPEEITDGFDELGVLIYGHKKNAYWFGSQLTIQDTVRQIEKQNATGLQVTTAIIAAMKWALLNPNQGVVQTQKMDYKQCLDIQQTYLGKFTGFYTNWNPLEGQKGSTQKSQAGQKTPDAWQFKHMYIAQK